MKFDYSDEALRRMAEDEDKLEVRIHPDSFIAHVDAIDARPTALRALRAAVDARLAGADWPAVVAAAQRAANGGER